MNAPVIRSAARDWRRIDGIDLLRGLSILLVLMNHVNMRLLSVKLPYTRGLPDQLVDSLVWNGQFGVQLFFVISGFLIMSTSIRRWGAPGKFSPAAFYTLRFARIAPLMLALLAILSALHFLGVSGYVVRPKTGGLGRALLAALTFHINYLEAARGYLPGNWDILWSLSVEEMFYLFFPLVARALRTKRFLIPVLLCFIVAGPFARVKPFNMNPVWREYSYLGGMDAIAIGCLAALLTAGRKLRRPVLLAFGWIGSALLVFSLCFTIKAYQLGLGKSGLNMTILAAGGALVIIAATQSEWRAPRLLTPLRVLGQRSYEIYLTHMFAVMALFDIFLHLGKPMRGVPILFVMAIVTAGFLGWLVAVTFAEPMNRWIRRRAGAGESVLGAAQPEVD
jgi:peptidoglycan/LPS O-acetylase OafA/YrhL